MNRKNQEIEKIEIGGSAVKEYIALVRGDCRYLFSSEESISNDNIYRRTTNTTSTSTVVTVNKPLNVSGVMKDAVTEFRLLASSTSTNNMCDFNHSNSSIYNGYDLSSCSLLLCQPRTGRTHQIRRHLRELSHPIIGDSEHGDSKVNRWWRENRNLNRLFLHCFSLDLPPLGSISGIENKNNSNKEAPDDESKNEKAFSRI